MTRRVALTLLAVVVLSLAEAKGDVDSRPPRSADQASEEVFRRYYEFRNDAVFDSIRVLIALPLLHQGTNYDDLSFLQIDGDESIPVVSIDSVYTNSLRSFLDANAEPGSALITEIALEFGSFPDSEIVIGVLSAGSLRWISVHLMNPQNRITAIREYNRETELRLTDDFADLRK